MKLKQLQIKQSLNKAYRLIKPERQAIEKFKANFKLLLGHINPQESEENLKGHVMDFLKNTYFNPAYHIATKGRTDFVIHTGKDATHAAGVLFEAKKPSNTEMVTTADLNRKAMHEIILYYLRERIEHHNNDIRYIVITSIYEWFVFDATEFERLFYKNNTLIKEYKAWMAKQKVSTNKELFYNEIAKPLLAGLSDEIEFTWFDIRVFEKPLLDSDKNNDNKLIPLFKILSPTHLLKLPFANDSNTLDKDFYNELLYLIGLEEIKDGSKKIIRRQQASKRNDGSLLENTIIQLDTENCIHKVSDRQSYGDTTEEQFFSVALELCITWVNRILFLKLLEAQLLKYHKGNSNYCFLNYEVIPQYDELYKLFFQVLARKQKDRIERVRAKYKHIPYLNSSLFEITVLEEQTIRINMLDDTAEMPLPKFTVLTDDRKRPIAPKLNTLQYIFEFLNAYDFASEGSEEIQEEQKTLINASVLGLIFEKINGYKDGSIFTPGFITMYMCRQSIRQAVLNKFKEKYTWKAETFEDLHNYIADDRTAKTIKEYNAHINSLTICDPAVGSGHFLVSALNELIAIKSELGILADANGKRLSEHTATIENDELLIIDRERNFFTYHVAITNENITIPNSEIQRVQETLFHEKQTIIENCLFGVDINPKSVQICRLRLWIELLKNAYYMSEGSISNGELQTLPNIDINIKTGNSLISRFGLDEDLKAATPYFEKKILEYKSWVTDYKHEADKEKKRAIQQLMADLKNGFLSKVTDRNPTKIKVDKLSKEFLSKYVSEKLFSQNLTDAQKKDKERLDKEIEKLNKELEAYIKSPVYHNAFEWRFEFPEVLNNEGNFIGFDVIIGNPPYIAIQDLTKADPLSAAYYRTSFSTTKSGNFDIYIPFIELVDRISNSACSSTFILPSKFLTTDYGKEIRNFLLNKNLITQIIDFQHHQVFDAATTYTCIILLDKIKKDKLSFIAVEPANVLSSTLTPSTILYEKLVDKTWVLEDEKSTIAFDTYKDISKLIDLPCDISRGSSTGDDKIYVLKKVSENSYLNGYGDVVDIEETFLVKPIYATDFSRYAFKKNDDYFVIFPYNINNNYQLLDEHFLSQQSPKLYNYLLSNKLKLEKRKQYGKWYGYSAARNLKIHGKSDILIPLLANKGLFSITPKDNTYTLMAGGGFSVSIKNKAIDKNYLLALLNSKFLFFLLYKESNKFRGGYITCTKQYFENLPIKIVDAKQQEPFISLVNQILSLKEDNSKIHTSDLENAIDQMVYKLYDLKPEEIQIIESSIK